MRSLCYGGGDFENYLPYSIYIQCGHYSSMGESLSNVRKNPVTQAASLLVEEFNIPINRGPS